MSDEPKPEAIKQEPLSPRVPDEPPIIVTGGPPLSEKAEAALSKLWEMAAHERPQRWRMMLDEFPELAGPNLGELLKFGRGRSKGVTISDEDISALLEEQSRRENEESQQ
jgi:DNA-binding TFAR19-related protein (PDSD5 family)